MTVEFSNQNYMMNFGELLSKTLSPVQTEREQATQKLETAANENLAMYMVCLSQELANDQQQTHIRSSAGIALKNALTARDYTRKEQLQQRWIALDLQAKQQIKNSVLSTLFSKDSKASTAAGQVISAIASIELPRNEWNDLIQTLLNNVTNPSSPSHLKQASLQAIGFVCEEMPAEVLETQADQILTAVVQGARKEETDPAVRLTALQALSNSLEFIRKNFDNPKERDFIMQVVCEATTSPDTNVILASFECLVKIMSLYYDQMGFYMQQALFALTINGMKSDDERICLQAIEFWSTVCDEEIILMEDAAEAAAYGEKPERFSQYFSKAALTEIVPVLLWLLTKQEEDDDEDEWSPAMAAGTCLSLLAKCVENDIVPPVVPFVEQNISHPEWRLREASVMAFGSILEGPQSNILQPLVSQALPVIIKMMQDPEVLVKDTAAWTLGRISELHPNCINTEIVLPNLMNALLNGLQDSPRVAAHCAWAIMNLSEQYGNEENDAMTYPLSPYFQLSVGALLNAAVRSDANESSLRNSSYEALSSLILTAPADCIQVVQSTSTIILERLEQSIQMESQLVGMDDRNQLIELQMALCGVVQSFSRKLGKEINPMADRIMTIFFKIFQSSSKTATTVEDVFLAIGVLFSALEDEFSRYLEAFAPYLFAALQNHEEHQLCAIAVGLVGDLCRALNDRILPLCDQIMSFLLQNLQSNILHRDVKPPILSCFGDLALAIQSKFENYLSVVMAVLQQACNMRAEEHDYDMIDYVNSLREGILEAYTGIVQGFKADKKPGVILPFAEPIFSFIHLIAQDPERPESVTRAAVGLLGDLADALGPQIKFLLVADWVENLLNVVRSDRSLLSSTKEVTKWARVIIKKATS